VAIEKLRTTPPIASEELVRTPSDEVRRVDPNLSMSSKELSLLSKRSALKRNSSDHIRRS
jgi:hypothetical protein